MSEFNSWDFKSPLSPMRFQSQLGKETKRLYGESKNIVRLSLARVVKVNYKYNTVDVVTTLHKDSTSKTPSDNGKYSARLPVSFGGRTPDGKVYGSTTLVTVGSLVLIGFLEGNKDYPIVLNIYGESDNQSQLTRTTYTSGDESNEEIQKELWQLFNLYPSMTYRNVDGHGNQEITFSGKTFLYITDSDQENEYVQDAEFDYEHLPSARYANGDLIEPKSPDSPTLLYVHQGVYGDHRVTFFIKSDGTVRVGSRHLDGEGITYQELNTDGSYNITQKHDTVNPEELSEKFSTMSMDDEGNITLKSLNHSLEIRNDGAFLNGRPLGAVGEQQLRDLERGILDNRTSINVLDGQIELKASRTEVDSLTEIVMEQEASLIVAFNEIATRVSRAEFETLAKGSPNLLHNTSFTDTLIAYGEGTTLQVRQRDVNELEVRRAGGTEKWGVYIGQRFPMYLTKGNKYTLSFEGYFGNISEVNMLYIVTSEGLAQKLPDLQVQESTGLIDDYPKYVTTFTSEETYEDTAYLLFAVDSVESDQFTIRKVQLESGDRATEWYPSYRDFAVVNLYETQIRQLADEISLTARSLERQIDDVNGEIDEAIARINEAELKITPEAIVSTVRSSTAYMDDFLHAREYVDTMIGEVNSSISGISNSLNDLDNFINGAFHDGIISEAEAQAIAKYINMLQNEKSNIDAKYQAIIEKEELFGSMKTSLENAKSAYNTAHNDLINTINNAISDGHVTPEESANVDSAFATYRLRLAILSDMFEEAINWIGSVKAQRAEDNAKNHANGLHQQTQSEIEQLSDQINLRVTEETYNSGIQSARDYAEGLFNPISQDLTELAGSLNDLDEYINGAFHNGVISEAEAKAIAKYINTLDGEKKDIDARYQEIINNPDLPDPVRTELQSAKSGFNTSHTNLISAINTAIADGRTTVEEAIHVDTMFTAYNNTLQNLTRWFEEAANEIGNAKAQRAEQRAKEYTDEELGIVSERVRQAELKITPEAITSTVRSSTEYMNDLGEKVGVNEVISRINQTAEEIQIEANKIRITGDTYIEEGALRWDYSQGGILQLGGVDNQNGVLEVYNSDGELIADLDGDRGGFSKLTIADLEVTENFIAPDVVKEQADDVEYRVRGTQGSDDNAGNTGSWNDALYSLQEAINRLPKIINGNVDIIFSGLYDITENNVIIQGFSGGGTLTIDFRGNTFRGRLRVLSCNVRIVIRDGTVISSNASHPSVIDNESSTYVNVSDIEINGRGNSAGVRTWRNGVSYLANMEVKNVESAYLTQTVGRTYHSNTIGHGSNYGIRATSGGIVHLTGQGPTGGTSNGDVSSTGTALVLGSFSSSSGGGSTPPPPPVTEQTRTWTNSSSGQWRENFGGQWGGASSSNSVYQGKWGQWGLYKGCWFFGTGMRNELQGATIKRVRIRPRRASTGGFSSGVGIVFRMHSHSSRPSGEPNMSNTSHTVNFSRGERKWVTLPSSFHSLFSNGNWYGVGIYTTNTSDSRYAIMEPSIEVEVTYEK
ncbi:glycerophosphoryl diester phosphodiesterase [Bacillus phage Shbh1]|uniref:Putative tail fiber protein n=1 Tax=Bacillus phage Shbh1 TaxID=1796992 RepID=A0A142F1F0_9CAUD|nr:glycerophosphoryl diester phosphodiesterase [Bacillus phage Shbh1]AMQ66607.1 putative tail fiber protein [Bacillus phage Shbh1]